MKKWLTPPSFPDLEASRQARLLYRLMRAMGLLIVVSMTVGLLDPGNDVTVTLLVYGVVLCWLTVVTAIVRSGRVMLAAWT